MQAGEQVLLNQFGGERADVFVADDAFAVDEEGFRRTIDAVLDADAPVGIDGGKLVRVAQTFEPVGRRFVAVLVVQPDDGQHLLAGERNQRRVFLPAGHAPRTPDVEQPFLPAHGARREGLIGLAELR